MRIERVVLFVFVVAVVSAGLLALGADLFVGSHDKWSPRNYVAPNGSCIVPAQGDPLYDEWYAKNVNNPNCVALKTESEAHYIDSQAEKTRVETRVGLFGVFSTLAVVAIIGILLLMGLRREEQ